jgi:hypothetical protein
VAPDVAGLIGGWTAATSQHQLVRGFALVERLPTERDFIAKVIGVILDAAILRQVVQLYLRRRCKTPEQLPRAHALALRWLDCN